MIFALIIGFGTMLGIVHTTEWSLFSEYPVNNFNMPLDAIRNMFPLWTVIAAFLTAFYTGIIHHDAG